MLNHSSSRFFWQCKCNRFFLSSFSILSRSLIIWQWWVQWNKSLWITKLRVLNNKDKLLPVLNGGNARTVGNYTGNDRCPISGALEQKNSAYLLNNGRRVIHFRWIPFLQMSPEPSRLWLWPEFPGVSIIHGEPTAAHWIDLRALYAASRVENSPDRSRTSRNNDARALLSVNLDIATFPRWTIRSRYTFRAFLFRRLFSIRGNSCDYRAI